MKKTIIALTAMATILVSGCANAGPQRSGGYQQVYGTVTSVTENWVWQETRVPYESCTTVRVPRSGYYNSGGASGGDVLGGMIIGGLLGKGISGNDRGAAAGAILGGIISADNNHGSRVQTREYHEELRCVTNYETAQEMVQAGYSVDYMYQGHLYNLKTLRSRYNVGDKIRLNIRVSPIN
jgi:uncharacterized protein YcfJ